MKHPLRKLGIIIALALLLVGAIFKYSHHNRPASPSNARIDRIVIEKSRRTLTTFHDGKQLKTYHVALGRNPVGPKEEEGDMKTPEGAYRVDELKSNSDYHLALHISYPSATDTARAAARGVSAGSDIEIHGLPNGREWVGEAHRMTDWTSGCIAVTNEEIEEIWHAAAIGTIVEIDP